MHYYTETNYLQVKCYVGPLHVEQEPLLFAGLKDHLSPLARCCLNGTVFSSSSRSVQQHLESDPGLRWVP